MAIGNIGLLGKLKAKFCGKGNATSPIKSGPDYPTYGIKGGESLKPLEEDKVVLGLQKKEEAAAGEEVTTEEPVETVKDNGGFQPDINFAQEELQKGDDAVENWQLEDAAEAYTNAIKNGLETGEVYHKRGYALEHLSRYEEAIEDYTKAIELDDTNIETFTRRGETKMFLMHSLSEDEKQGSRGKILVRSAAKDYEKAIMMSIPEEGVEKAKADILKKFHENNPNVPVEDILDFETEDLCGSVNFLKKDFKKALRDFKNYIDYSTDTVNLDILAEIYGCYIGDGMSAAKCYERSTIVNEEALAQAESMLEGAGSEEEREALEGKIQELKTTLAREYKLAGHYYKSNEGMSFGKYDTKVLGFYQRGLELEPDSSAESFYRIGTVAPSHEERVANLKKAVKLNPDDPKYHEQLAQEYGVQYGQFESEEQRANYMWARTIYDINSCTPNEVSPEDLQKALGILKEYDRYLDSLRFNGSQEHITGMVQRQGEQETAQSETKAVQRYQISA